MRVHETAWWQTGVIYQIYPRSFQDTNGDGVGDLRGIRERLPYLVDLGVTAVWLSPIFPSPMADYGYDISDYMDIDPLFGTLAEFDALLDAAHGHGLKLILDLVPNHTSDQHPWFRESRASRHNSKRDWYIWREPADDGGPPNNWLSVFGGAAWEYDAVTGQYYYHAFLPAQPDLNWRNPQVRAAIYDVMRFWLRRGVDGFRVDVIWHLIKDDQFRDNPPNPAFTPDQPAYHSQIPFYTTDRPEIHDVIAEMRAVIEEFSDRVLIGEIYLPIERLVAYYGRNLTGLHLPFNFSLLTARWKASTIASLIGQYEAALPAGGWPNWVLGNHDQPRMASRVGSRQARVAAVLLLTLHGTPTIYYGDEIGMEQVALTLESARDPCAREGFGRDGCRTPMQWDASPYAGFSTVEPWLPIAPNAGDVNVAAARADPASLYRLHQRLLNLRRSRSALIRGAYRPVIATDDLMAYIRELDGEALLIVLNFRDAPQDVTAPAGPRSIRVLLSSYGDREDEELHGEIHLRPDEGVVIELLE